MKSIHVLRKPCSKSTVAANVLKYGTGGLNVDGSRIAWASPEDAAGTATGFAKSMREGRAAQSHSIGRESRDGTESPYAPPASGRWPANLLLGACIDGELDEVFPHTKAAASITKKAGSSGSGRSFKVIRTEDRTTRYADDEGSAARYFKRVGE